jgi:23S rRNA (adenine2503-C2)-methyltransferase
MKKANIYDSNFEELSAIIQDWGEPSYRAVQIWEGLFHHYWSSWESFTTLSLPLRTKLNENFQLNTIQQDQEQRSEDGETTKLLYRLNDDTAIETVLMSYRERYTVCISSQAGCAMGCDFCATGDLGFIRNLTTGEIVEQVIRAAEIFQLKNKKLTNVVFMGMGEPFHNYSAVLKASKILNDPVGFSLGARRITISTVGLVPGIKKFAQEKTQMNLAISLHAADDELRSSMMPVNKKYPISDLMKACQEYISLTNRRISIEWALIEGVNDTEEQAHKLIGLIKGKLFHVNLIRLNPVKHYSGNPTNTDQAATFQKQILDAGIPCTFRVRRGIDIQAGCGQLASQLQ